LRGEKQKEMTKQEQSTIESMLELMASVMELKAENAALKAENELLKKILDRPELIITNQPIDKR